MRNMKKDRTHKWVHMSHPAIPWIATLLLLVFAWSASAESGKTGGSKPAQADYGHIEGKWLRPDGGYVLELSNVKSEGQLKAAYFNPRPINVGKAGWRSLDARIQVFVKLQDVNYPGSTYKLIYDPEHDQFLGSYYQAVTKETFEVVFVRKE
jgi:hypothetical protein